MIPESNFGGKSEILIKINISSRMKANLEVQRPVFSPTVLGNLCLFVTKVITLVLDCLGLSSFSN